MTEIAIGKADEAGNNLVAVGIPVTGTAAFAPIGTKVPTPTEGKAPSLVLDQSFKKLGLFTEDGGPEWGGEAGDEVKLYQEGYAIPDGTGSATVKLTFAQTDQTLMEFLRGRSYDADGHMIVDAASGRTEPFVLYVEDIFKNGVIRRRLCENAAIKEVKETALKRGEIAGWEVEITLNVSPKHPTGNYHEWLIKPAAA